jgi:hypothetical protein
MTSSIHNLEPIKYGKFVEDADEIVNNGDLDQEIVEEGEGDGTEVLIQVYVPGENGRGKLFNVVELQPRDDGKAIVLNLSPIGADI